MFRNPGRLATVLFETAAERVVREIHGAYFSTVQRQADCVVVRLCAFGVHEFELVCACWDRFAGHAAFWGASYLLG